MLLGILSVLPATLISLSLSLPLFPFIRGEVLPATFSPPHLLFFSTLLCLLPSSSSLPPLLSSSHLSLITQSSHLSIGLPRLLLPCSRNSAALFDSLSSAILSTCPAHCNLLLTSLSVKLLCTPLSPLNSTIFRLSALVTLAIFRTQLFSHTCSLRCCSSVRAKVSVTSAHDLAFQCLDMCVETICFDYCFTVIFTLRFLHCYTRTDRIDVQ